MSESHANSLSPEFIAQNLIRQYDLLKPVDVQFHASGLHHNFLVHSGNARYILRLYRSGWRNMDEIQFELELLNFLRNRTRLVACPKPTRDGALSFTLDGGNSSLNAALFEFAEGIAPGTSLNQEQSRLLGESIANIHRLTNKFQTGYQRPRLELPYLLDESVKVIQPFLEPDEIRFLDSLQELIHRQLPNISMRADTYGVCMGDLNPRNFHINTNNQITLFDFDQCGFGYRAFEIGKFFSSLINLEGEDALRKEFVHGYETVRKLDAEELAAIPWFKLVSIIWVMAIHAYNKSYIDPDYLNHSFWQRRITILTHLQKELLPTSFSRI